MNLVICEDQQEHSKNLIGLVLSWAKSRNITINCEIFKTPEELLVYIKNNKNIDLMFLDVYFENSKLDGITLAKNLRKEGIMIQIILTTMDRLQAVNGFFIEALGFLAKPVQEDELSIFMDRLLKKLTDNKFIEVTSKGHKIKVYQKDIIYFERIGRKLVFYTLKGSIDSDMSISEAISMLDKDKFTKIYRSVVIAFDKIKSIKTSRPPSVIIMNNEKEINLEISRYTIKKFIESYSNYMRSELL